MTIKSIRELGNFPSIKDDNENLYYAEKDLVTNKVRVKRKKKRKKNIINTPLIYTKQEEKFINRINKAKDKLSVIGRIKGTCHKKDINPAVIISYLKTININWYKIRDSTAMKKYKKKNPICEKCHINKTEHCHHILPISKQGKEIENNYLAVCKNCHGKLHPDLPWQFFI